MNTSRLVFRAFKAKGLSISADATQALCSVLAREDDVEGSIQLVLDALKERIEKQDVRSTIIDVKTIQAIVAELSSSEEDIAQESVQLLDSFNLPKLCFDEKQKSFKMTPTPKYQLLGTADSRAAMYRERLLFTQQRLLRSELFTLKGLGNAAPGRSGANKDNAVHELSSIESLLGSVGTRVLFGMLTQPEEGAWFLEDLGSMIKLDLSRAQTYNVFFTEGSQVVVQGELVDSVFRVQVMGIPPAEERSVSLKAIGVDDIFGCGIRPQQMLQLAEMEAAQEDKLVVILSDVQLDKPLVLEKLQSIFAGFENNGSEPLYILMGSFVSKPLGRAVGGREVVQGAFDTLADIIAKFPNQAQNAKFLFVPGPLDAGTSVALPRRPIPEQYTKSLRQRVRHVTFASNPCRVRYFTQEIVLFREDLLKKMQRHLAVPLVLDDPTVPDITVQLVESLLDQAHLCPLPLHAKPVYWELDYALRLFPLPHLLVLADHVDHFEHTYKGCNTVNPGSFSSDFSFIVYQPATRETQFSRAP